MLYLPAAAAIQQENLQFFSHRKFALGAFFCCFRGQEEQHDLQLNDFQLGGDPETDTAFVVYQPGTRQKNQQGGWGDKLKVNSQPSSCACCTLPCQQLHRTAELPAFMSIVVWGWQALHSPGCSCARWLAGWRVLLAGH